MYFKYLVYVFLPATNITGITSMFMTDINNDYNGDGYVCVYVVMISISIEAQSLNEVTRMKRFSVNTDFIPFGT